jgi:hypothetical protein
MPAAAKLTLTLALAVAAGAVLACDESPAGLTGPTPQPETRTTSAGCFGRSSAAKQTDDGWEVVVYVPAAWGCDAHHCTVRDPAHELTQQGAIVECRRVSGITGPNA